MRLTRSLIIVAVALAACAFGQEKEKPPAGDAPKPFRVPATETFTLKNGMKVTLAQYGNIPKVTIEAVVRCGNIDEAANQVWLADVMADLMKEGAGSRNGAQIAAEAARMGGQIDIGAGPDETVVSADALSEFAPDMIALMADVIERPAFPASELPRIVNDSVRRLSVARTRPQSLADEAFRKALYPDHPYGRLFPTEEMLKGYTVESVRGFYKANFGAARTHLYIVGRFSPDVTRAVRTAFEGWARGSEPKFNIPKPAAAKSFVVIDRPGAVQSTIRLGLPVLNPKNPDYVAFAVMNALLGGSFNSRITANIREQKGYTYSPYSVVSTRYRDGFWAQNADVTTADTGAALKEIVFEIDRMRKEPPSQEELQGIKNYLAGTFVLQNSSRRGIANQLVFVNLHELGEEYLKTFVQRVQAVTPADVQRMARTYLDPAKMTLAVAGDQSKIASQIEPFK